ncbi:hypothetical protein N7495_001432 [Penicillium taxi]|uniref:uncharacterized protein n=1 Tax=Penicillium taxi TaxID=168475 RepID=UPI0025453729|nr:uncharacterized protein N7495_001432 [Penicillium taxi]KAJ5908750.1 hypothetical protein N7495_001432 [Penicillium taxi]
MDNSGNAPLQVPGFGNIPLYYDLPAEARFVHGIVDWIQAPIVTARELAMVGVMDRITDHPTWFVDIFNHQTIANWRKEAFDTTPLMSEMAWTWCVKELQDKALFFRENQHVRVLDTGSCVCKSDTTTLSALSGLFRQSVPSVLMQQLNQESPQSTNFVDSQTITIVDPFLFPLVYGRTLVLANGGTVDLKNIMGSYKDTTIAPKHIDRRVQSHKFHEFLDAHPQLSTQRGFKPSIVEEPSWNYLWSSNFQSLPCEVGFIGDSGTDVRITSYINNLHPSHKALYHAIEKLVSLAIKPFNNCLIQGQSDHSKKGYFGQFGRVPLRIMTFGVEWENDLLDWADAFDLPSEETKKMYHKAKKIIRKNNAEPLPRKYWSLLRIAEWDVQRLGFVADRENDEPPPEDSELWDMAKKYLELPEESNDPIKVPDDWAKDAKSLWYSLTQKVERVIRFKHPEPGAAFSYEDWKTGQNNKPVIDVCRAKMNDLDNPFYGISIPKPYDITLEETFREQGLQIIVKMENIELSPQNSSYPGNDWQLDGQLNEHIVAIATFAYDVANITEPRIAFRQYTDLGGRFYHYNEESWETSNFDLRNLPARRRGKKFRERDALAEILGFTWDDLDYITNSAPFQNIGSVATPQGRLVTFPHVLEHQLAPFQLADPSLPGHYRSIKLYLVDPHYRICSTRNVPPQQHDWWADEVGKDLPSVGLPQELVNEILQYTDSWPMGMQEATEHRRELIKEHHWREVAKLINLGGVGF